MIKVEKTRYAAGFQSHWHAHEKAQLIYPSKGVMRISLDTGMLIVPPLRACWLPADAQHRVETKSGLEMHSAYCSGAILAHLPAEIGIVAVDRLLREIILALGSDRFHRETQSHLAAIFCDLVRIEEVPRLFVPTLTSERLSLIQGALREDPASSVSLQEWAKELGMSPRTLARAFRREAGMSFTNFRMEMRLHAAIEQLGTGAPVTAVAYDTGFSSASNFIAMFRKATGKTPKAYFGKP